MHADQAAYLAWRLDMQLVMCVTRPHGQGTYGNAVLTRLPLLGSSTCDLSRIRREPRACLRADLAVNGRTLHAFNCHFGLGLRERRAQVAMLARFIRDSAALVGPRVLMGDFNEWHPGPVSRGLKREFSSPMRRMRRTHPALFPLFKLDRIYWDVELEGQTFHVHRSRLARVASDHLPVVARLRVRDRAVAAPTIPTSPARRCRPPSSGVRRPTTTASAPGPSPSGIRGPSLPDRPRAACRPSPPSGGCCSRSLRSFPRPWEARPRTSPRSSGPRRRGGRACRPTHRARGQRAPRRSRSARPSHTRRSSFVLLGPPQARPARSSAGTTSSIMARARSIASVLGSLTSMLEREARSGVHGTGTAPPSGSSRG